MAAPLAPYLLLIDDDEAILESYSMFLSDNFNVDTCNTVEAAISKIATDKYAVAIIDMDFPDDPEGGIRILSNISRTKTKTKAIMLSAYGTVETCRRAFKKGAYDFIEKSKADTRAKVLAAAIEATR